MRALYDQTIFFLMVPKMNTQRMDLKSEYANKQ